MKKWLIGLVVGLLCGVLAVPEAEARRLGGGRPLGAQRSVPQKPPAATPARPAQQQAAPQAAQSRWGAMLGGLALGGLLAFLLWGNGLGGILLLVALALVAMLVWRTLSNRAHAVQYAGTGHREHVVMPPAGGAVATPSRLPAGFDAAAFLRGARTNFVKLQLANDRGDLEEIRDFTTGAMFEELQKDVAARGGAPQHTEIEALEAELLEVITEGDEHWASVRFSGFAREARGEALAPFAEVWHLLKPTDGSSGWLLAGIQQMH
jgi:predicted lipid-binding transport protein (Tim44 family)